MRFGKVKLFASFPISLLLLIFSAQTGFAHTEIVNSIPASNSVLSVLPSKVTIEFSENLLVLADKETSSVSVVSQDGEIVDDGNSTFSARELSVGLIESTTLGSFTVTWRVVADDGHPVNGKYSFEVDSPQSLSTTEEVIVPSESAGPLVTTTESENSGNSSLLGIAIVGVVILIGLTLLMLRWRRNSGG